MGKIKFTKTELKHQQDEKKQFLRFLPTLQLKKQQLQFEVRQCGDLLEANTAAMAELKRRMASFVALYGDPDDLRQLEESVRVRRVVCGETNIAGIAIPTFERVDFEPAELDLFATPWRLDDLADTLRRMISLRREREVLGRQHDLLTAELRSTSQRVNLFEKVKIPECRENIRRIGIMLGDLNTSAVARCKIAKRKASAAAAAAMA